MEFHKAIPQGYMTVGEIAKKMNTTVRTLQYYDKIGLLSPSAASEGGRRLYTDSDIVKLHQIQSMKYLGFSLDAIKNRVIFLETPEEVADALAEQAQSIREEIEQLTENLAAIEKLREETLRMQTVDWKKYALMLVLFQTKNEFYSVIKHFDEEVLNHYYNLHCVDTEKHADIVNALVRLCGKVVMLQKKRIDPESEIGQAVAQEYWDIMMELTGGNVGMVGKHIQSTRAEYGNMNIHAKKLAAVCEYLEVAVKKYCVDRGINPFREG